MTDEQPQRPTDDNPAAWRAYWQALGMPWRTEPEIDAARQAYLAERRAVTPDIERGIYPFRDENGSIKLTRADVEWLLATHESRGIRGPVDWEETSQRKRSGVDVRGANLADTDLSDLPLARLHGGFGGDEFSRTAGSQRLAEAASVQLEQARLIGAHLEGSTLTYANLRGADLTNAYLESADLFRAHFGAERPGSWVRTFFDARTVLREAVLANANQVSPRMLDVRWGGVNLTALDWAPVRMVGDEYRARQRTVASGEQTDRTSRLREYQAAVRTNRQLATVLRGQGLNEDADRFAYRAQLLQRVVLRRQRRWGRAFGSWLLDTVAGYGYKPMRSVIAYVLIICLFAGAYLLNAQFAAPHLSWDEALVLSISSFHGRGFFTTGISLGDTLARLAAGEALIGLLIEITFIATFTQRFFAR